MCRIIGTRNGSDLRNHFAYAPLELRKRLRHLDHHKMAQMNERTLSAQDEPASQERISGYVPAPAGSEGRR
jgi:hypothetical protein